MGIEELLLKPVEKIQIWLKLAKVPRTLHGDISTFVFLTPT